MKFVFEAIGTKWQIDIYDNLSKKIEDDFLNKIKLRIETFDKTYSRFRTDSLVTKMSRQKDSYKLPDDAQILFSLYKKLYEITGGTVTPLIGQLLADTGYDADYSFQQKKLTKPSEWEDIIDYKFPKLFLKKPALLDFGATGKGYLIDIISQLLEENNIRSYCVDAGGDIRYKHQNKKPLRVGLENPENTKQVIGVVNITNQSICGSAGNRRKWGKYHHILNPKTMEPVKNILATWAIAETTIVADAMTTCLFFVPNQILLKDYNFEYLVLHDDHTVEVSSKFPGEIFVK